MTTARELLQELWTWLDRPVASAIVEQVPEELCSRVRAYLSAAPVEPHDFLAGAKWMQEQAAKACELSRSETSLMAGEMTSVEWRTLNAVLTNRAATIRSIPLEGM